MSAFGHEVGKIFVDGCLQPGCPDPADRLVRRTRPEVQSEAALHHIQGWTALCFWDYSVDQRGACNSNYFAEGEFTFGQMVEMAKTRFAQRWNRMKFEVRLVFTDRPVSAETQASGQVVTPKQNATDGGTEQ